MKIKKLSEEILFKETRIKHTFELDGKKVIVIATNKEDNMNNDYDSDTYVLNEREISNIELEAIGEYMAENLDLKEGEEWDTDKDTN